MFSTILADIARDSWIMDTLWLDYFLCWKVYVMKYWQPFQISSMLGIEADTKLAFYRRILIFLITQHTPTVDGLNYTICVVIELWTDWDQQNHCSLAFNALIRSRWMHVEIDDVSPSIYENHCNIPQRMSRSLLRCWSTDTDRSVNVMNISYYKWLR